MRIAFVGKGGSGKTTMTALFTKFLEQKDVSKIVSIDADINVHLPELLTGKDFPTEKFLSNSNSEEIIKKYLMGENNYSLQKFRKTTPPNSKSNIFDIEDEQNKIINKFSLQKNKTNVMAVGTYSSEGIGASCYHNNLAILENILTHSKEKEGAIIVDMVAGTDAFASSLHAQFDIIILVVEPTKRSVEVFNQYKELSKKAGMYEDVFVVGNKVIDKEDEIFLKEKIPSEKLMGFVNNSSYLKEHDRKGGEINFESLEEENKKVFQDLFKKLEKSKKDPNKRLNKIYELHKNYVSQSFIKDRFGDLTNQIEVDFKL